MHIKLKDFLVERFPRIDFTIKDNTVYIGRYCIGGVTDVIEEDLNSYNSMDAPREIMKMFKREIEWLAFKDDSKENIILRLKL